MCFDVLSSSCHCFVLVVIYNLKYSLPISSIIKCKFCIKCMLFPCKTLIGRAGYMTPYRMNKNVMGEYRGIHIAKILPLLCYSCQEGFLIVAKLCIYLKERHKEIMHLLVHSQRPVTARTVPSRTKEPGIQSRFPK